MYTTITAKSYPKLHKALLNIAKDNLDVTKVDETLPKVFNITNIVDIKSIEKSLNLLSRTEFEDLKEFTELSILFYKLFVKQDKTIIEITIES